MNYLKNYYYIFLFSLNISLSFSITESSPGVFEGACRASPGSRSSRPEHGEGERQERERQELLGAEPQGAGKEYQRAEGGSERI